MRIVLAALGIMFIALGTYTKMNGLIWAGIGSVIVNIILNILEYKAK